MNEIMKHRETCIFISTLLLSLCFVLPEAVGTFVILLVGVILLALFIK